MIIPVTYKITDYNGEEIQGLCYEQELQKTPQSTFRIEKVLKRQGDKSLVKLMEYPKSFNSWIDTKAMVKTNYRENALKLYRKKHSLKHVLIITTKYHLISINNRSSRSPHLHAQSP